MKKKNFQTHKQTLLVFKLDPPRLMEQIIYDTFPTAACSCRDLKTLRGRCIAFSRHCGQTAWSNYSVKESQPKLFKSTVWHCGISSQS